MTDKKVAGLWIDGRKAIVVTNHNAQEVTDFAVRVVKADVQHGNSNRMLRTMRNRPTVQSSTKKSKS
jgi:hypothetical protein